MGCEIAREIELLTQFRFVLATSRKMIGREEALGEPVRLGLRALFGLHELQSRFLVLRKRLQVVTMHEDVAEFMGENEARLRLAPIGKLPYLTVDVQCQRRERDIRDPITFLVENIEFERTKTLKLFADKSSDDLDYVKCIIATYPKLFAGVNCYLRDLCIRTKANFVVC